MLEKLHVEESSYFRTVMGQAFMVSNFIAEQYFIIRYAIGTLLLKIMLLLTVESDIVEDIFNLKIVISKWRRVL